MPLPFNQALDRKLIELVKENPIIYNMKHPKYLDFDSREVVWQKIGDSLNRPGSLCKSRWINIRDMMRRKFKERLKNPHHRIYKYKYEDELGFMTPYFRDVAGPSEEFEAYLDDEASCEVEMPAEVFVNENGDLTETKEIKINFKKRNDDASCSSSREFNTEAVFQELNPADPLDVFLITIGTTLRKFSPYYLNQAKSKIFQVVQDYELQQIVNKDDQAQGNGEGNR